MGRETTSGRAGRWPRVSLRRAALVAPAVAWLACAPSRDGGAAVVNVPSLAAALDRIDTPRLTPRGPAARVYQSQPASERPLALFQDTLRQALFRSIREAGASQGVTVLADSRLDAAMTDLASAVPEEHLPRSDALEFLLAHYGAVEPYPELQVIRVHEMAEGELVGEVLRSFALPRINPLVSVGIGVDRATTYRTVFIAVQPKHLDLAPVARAHTAAAGFELVGRLLGRFDKPRVFVTIPSGGVQQYGLETRGDAFHAKVLCDRGKGRYQVEVFGDDHMGPRVLANFPVYCGEEPPHRYDGPAGYRAQRMTGEAAEEMLLSLLNRARAEAGLSPLEPDEKLAAVARAHSRDMHRGGFVAHVSPTTGHPIDRVRAAGLAPSRLLENIGTDGSPEEIHHGLMRSPGHRSAILDPHVAHVGIGVAVSAPTELPIRYYATELFR